MQTNRVFNDKKVLLSTHSLSFSYDKQTQLSNINLNCYAGEFIGLIGCNGAGKSTLLKLLLGLLPSAQGQVRINQQPLTHFKRREIAKQIAFVPQSIDLPFAFSVEEVVMMGRNPYLGAFQLASAQDRKIVKKAMHTTDISHLMARKVNQLSGGEKQRVIIARALAQQSLSILLDEPIASLDISHQFETLDLIQSLTEKGKLAITAIHDLNLAAHYCSRLILLGKNSRGEVSIVSNGSPKEVLNKQNLKTHFNIEADIIEVDIINETNIEYSNINPQHQRIQLTNIRAIKKIKAIKAIK